MAHRPTLPVRPVLLALLAALLPSTPRAAPPKGAPPRTADVVFLNGKIVTFDPRNAVVSAVAIRDGRFVAVGSDEAVRKLVGERTRVVDLAGKTAIPGLIDSHCHPAPTMVFTKAVDGRAPGVPSVAQLLKNVEARARATPKGEWIVAVGASASQTKYVEHRLPTRAELDLAAPENPVWFWNGTHAEVLNSKGLAARGVEGRRAARSARRTGRTGRVGRCAIRGGSPM